MDGIFPRCWRSERACAALKFSSMIVWRCPRGVSFRPCWPFYRARAANSRLTRKCARPTLAYVFHLRSLRRAVVFGRLSSSHNPSLSSAYRRCLTPMGDGAKLLFFFLVLIFDFVVGENSTPLLDSMPFRATGERERNLSEQIISDNQNKLMWQAAREEIPI